MNPDEFTLQQPEGSITDLDNLDLMLTAESTAVTTTPGDHFCKTDMGDLKVEDIYGTQTNGAITIDPMTVLQTDLLTIQYLSVLYGTQTSGDISNINIDHKE